MAVRLLAPIAIALALIAGPASANERLYWEYESADRGILALLEEGYTPFGNPSFVKLVLACGETGSLSVEARSLMLSTDVGGASGTYGRLALETSALRIETPIKPVGTGYETWVTATYPNGTKMITGLLAAPLLIVRAVNDTPVDLRTADESDMVRSYPSPDWEKAAPFRNFCTKSIAVPKP